MAETKPYWTEPGDVDDVAVLEEAAADGAAKTPKLSVTVIREGFSANHYPPFSSRRHKYRLYYTPQAVKDIAQLIEGKPAYVGAPDEHGGFRSLRDNVVGIFENVRVEQDGGGKSAARAEIAVYPHQMWIVDMARVNRRAFGPSIEGDPENIRRGKVGNVDAAIVESVKKIYGALLVVNPAAGGGLEGILESRQREKRGKKMRLAELEEAEQAEVMAEARKLVEAETDVKAKDERIKSLEESVKKLEDEKVATAAVLAEAKSREILEAAFPKELPQVARDRLYEACKGETDEAKIKEAVKKEAEYIAAVNGGVKITGAPAAAEEGKTEPGSLAEAEGLAKDALGLTPPPEKK